MEVKELPSLWCPVLAAWAASRQPTPRVHPFPFWGGGLSPPCDGNNTVPIALLHISWGLCGHDSGTHTPGRAPVPGCCREQVPAAWLAAILQQQPGLPASGTPVLQAHWLPVLSLTFRFLRIGWLERCLLVPASLAEAPRFLIRCPSPAVNCLFTGLLTFLRD